MREVKSSINQGQKKDFDGRQTCSWRINFQKLGIAASPRIDFQQETVR